MAPRVLQQPSPKPILCMMCPDECLPAEFVCITCPGIGLCLGFKNKHLERAEDYMTALVKESKDAMCTKHPHKMVEFCCVNPCHELICAACGLLEHATQKFSSLREAAERERAEIERVAEESSQAISDSLPPRRKLWRAVWYILYCRAARVG